MDIAGFVFGFHSANQENRCGRKAELALHFLGCKFRVIVGMLYEDSRINENTKRVMSYKSVA